MTVDDNSEQRGHPDDAPEEDIDRVDYSQSLPPVTGEILESSSLPGFEDA